MGSVRLHLLCPRAAPQLSAAKGKGLKPLSGPVPHPLQACGLCKGRTNCSPAPGLGGESKACRAWAGLSSSAPLASSRGSLMRTGAAPWDGAQHRALSLPSSHRPLPWQEVTPAGPTARWTRPAPANPSTSGSSSRSCCSNRTTTGASSAGSTRTKVGRDALGAGGDEVGQEML